jgi:hypothetical protein
VSAAPNRVTVIHDLTQAQRQFIEAPETFRLFLGGIGSGKTRAGCLEVLNQPAGSQGMVVAPTFPMLRDSTLDTFMRLAVPSLVRDFNRAEMTMTLVNGVRVLWRSADNPDSLRGANLGWVFMDEASLMTEEVFDILLGRLREQPGRLWITTTPKGFNWLYRVFESERRPGYKLVRCSTRGNKFLPDGYIEALEAKYSGAWSKQELEGEWVEWTDSPCYHEMRRERNVQPTRAEYRPDLPLALCMDFNVRYMSWPYGQVIKGQPVVLGEVTCRRGAAISEMVRLFRNERPDHRGEVWVYGDASGRNRTAQTARSDYDLVMDAFKGYPSRVVVNAPAKNPPPRDRINAVNRILAEPEGRLLIDPSCAELISDLLQTEWDKTGSREQQYPDPEDDRNVRTHASSALGYWLWREFPVASVTAISRQRKPLRHKNWIGGLSE